MKSILPVAVLALALTGCSEPEPEGVYVEIDLENSKNINSYILFIHG